MTRTLLLCALLCLSAPAMAVYKCEAGGKVTYSDKPCAGGRQIDLGPGVSPSDTTQANSQLAQEKAKLAQLESERHKREAKEEKEQQKLARVARAKQNRCMAMARRRNAADEDAAAATGKAHDKAMRRLRRIVEEYEAECRK
ncbi:DUF4124 domain-containing protein [Noviherbaspirillum massiliense]|uniref:DUF4124 domain-containing protein n=1 Tax=Noviherbaspirillum massiliense TaxID=1465823 RepID=UPI0002F87A4F|nr:DUF4124 domain-containing protein [Noviherbaspirillum massiliense]